MEYIKERKKANKILLNFYKMRLKQYKKLDLPEADCHEQALSCMKRYEYELMELLELRMKIYYN
jgi:hypothetical protein